MKKYKVILLLLLICSCGTLIYYVSLPKGNTIESRELLLNDAISGERYPLTLDYNSGDIIDANFDSVNPLIKQGFIEINQQEY